MKQQGLDELYLWKKQQMTLLVEVMDLTEQLSQAAGRRDSVSVNMLVAMRQDPITQAQDLENRTREYLLTLPEETAIRLNGLLNGGEAETPEEERLAGQVAQNRRLLKRIRELDESTSLQLGGNRSFYRKFR